MNEDTDDVIDNTNINNDIKVSDDIKVEDQDQDQKTSVMMSGVTNIIKYHVQKLMIFNHEFQTYSTCLAKVLVLIDITLF